MGRQFNISDMGLKLIKAYEGFRPVDRTLVSGQRVVGYGHRLMDDKAVMLSKSEAENILKDDLAPFIDMINENVHAPLSQSQFDALVSFAYNIGPKAFLESDTLRALNNGRPLDAANGFDIWRKSEIEGKTYVVDALMRRRTAEKALFLRPEGRALSAPRVDLPPIEDEAVALLSTEDALPVFTADDAAGVVTSAPYSASEVQNRRRDDGPSGLLMLSEIADQDEGREDDYDAEELPFIPDTTKNVIDEDKLVEAARPSLIAAEDEKLKDRLNALIEDVKSDQKTADTEDWPDSLIDTDAPKKNTDANIIPFSIEKQDDVVITPGLLDESDVERTEIDAPVIDSFAEDDALQLRTDDSASRYIDFNARPEDNVTASTIPYMIMMFLGSILFGGGIALWLKNKGAMFGDFGPMLTMCGIFIGTMMLAGALYYAARQSFKRS
ncbi:lysozyme [Hellea balneolensis]|uniref:lysozyme n=1 Tax=Hellea balneolensis TaxID=287478 RepID=UPI00040574BB|nr:lysozyme [Hellea balneolensis]